MLNYCSNNHSLKDLIESLLVMHCELLAGYTLCPPNYGTVLLVSCIVGIKVELLFQACKR
jgi:hypothetical protein